MSKDKFLDFHTIQSSRDQLEIRGDSNEYPQSRFWSKNKKNMYTPAYPSFTIQKCGFKGVYITRTCFRDDLSDILYPTFVF